MRWMDAMAEVLDLLVEDFELDAIPGFVVLRRGEFTEPHVPSVAWLVFSDLIEENVNPIRVQFDVFARGLDQALTIEERLRDLLHRDTPQTLGGLKMWTELQDARDHEDPEPGVVHRSLDFAFTPSR